MGDAVMNWDEYFLNIAQAVKLRGTCSRAQVGCVIVEAETRHILATGYNGALPGARHCDHTEKRELSFDGGSEYSEVVTVGDMEHGHCSNALHAEANAVAHATKSLRGATAYVTVTPCLKCYQLLRAAGVKEIIYAGEYRPHPVVAAAHGLWVWKVGTPR